MRKGFTIAETVMSIALFGLLLVAVLQIGKNARLSYEMSMRSEARQSQDELVILALKPLFDNLRGFHWHETERKLFLWTSGCTAEVHLVGDKICLDTGMRHFDLTRDSVNQLDFSAKGRLFRVEITDAKDVSRPYFFSCASDSDDLFRD